jgi:pre-mRNA-processing factor SLU7
VEEKEKAWKDEERREEYVPNAVDRPEKTNMDESRRRLEELKSGVSEEEMEKYRRERSAKDDPMAQMLGRDELLS